MKDTFEKLINTIESKAINNEATIKNVELFAKSWRKERIADQTLTDEQIIDIADNFCSDSFDESHEFEYDDLIKFVRHLLGRCD